MRKTFSVQIGPLVEFDFSIFETKKKLHPQMCAMNTIIKMSLNNPKYAAYVSFKLRRSSNFLTVETILLHRNRIIAFNSGIFKTYEKKYGTITMKSIRNYSLTY